MSVGDTVKSLVVVQRACLYDSNALFHTDSAASMSSLRPYPGGHLYEFLAEGPAGARLRVHFRQHFEFGGEEFVPKGSPVRRAHNCEGNENQNLR